MLTTTTYVPVPGSLVVRAHIHGRPVLRHPGVPEHSVLSGLSATYASPRSVKLRLMVTSCRFIVRRTSAKQILLSLY